MGPTHTAAWPAGPPTRCQPCGSSGWAPGGMRPMAMLLLLLLGNQESDACMPGKCVVPLIDSIHVVRCRRGLRQRQAAVGARRAVGATAFQLATAGTPVAFV